MCSENAKVVAFVPLVDGGGVIARLAPGNPERRIILLLMFSGNDGVGRVVYK